MFLFKFKSVILFSFSVYFLILIFFLVALCNAQSMEWLQFHFTAAVLVQLHVINKPLNLESWNKERRKHCMSICNSQQGLSVLPFSENSHSFMAWSQSERVSTAIDDLLTLRWTTRLYITMCLETEPKKQQKKQGFICLMLQECFGL